MSRQRKAEKLHVAVVNTDEMRQSDIKTRKALAETSGCKEALHADTKKQLSSIHVHTVLCQSHPLKISTLTSVTEKCR